MNNLIPNESTHWQFSKGDSYYCDWRLTVTHCEGDIIFHYLGIINIVLTAIVVIIGYGLLYHRLVVLGQVVFEYRNNYLRPRAMESIILFMSLFNSVRLIQSIIIITDNVQNIFFRQFIFEFGYELGYTTLGCYLFGIVHALRESDRVIFEQWIKSPKLVDISCTLLIVAPFITNTICSLGAGISALNGNHELANHFTQALYTVWTLHCLVLSSLTLISGWRLVRILEQHIKKKEETQTVIDVSKVQLGAQKVKIIALTSSICLYLYSGVSLTYATIRYKIHTNIVWNMIFCISWNGLGLVASILIAFAVILNPKMKLTLLFSYGSSGAARSEGTGVISSKFSSTKKDKKLDNTTVVGGSTTIGSVFDTHTFEEGSDFLGYGGKKNGNHKNNNTNNNENIYTTMDVAPTLSTAIAMKFSHSHHNPLVMDEHDVELVHAYPESTKSSTQLVVDEKSYHY
ncbi:unnamed protein product [Cunninghamella echinulata]